MLLELGWWCLMPLSTIFQLYRGGQFIGGGNPEKTTNLSQVAGRENHIMLYQEVRKHMSEIRTHNLCGDQNVVR